MSIKKVDIGKFDLQKIKLSGKSLIVEFYDLDAKNDLVTINSDSDPSPDLSTALDDLKTVFASAFGLLSGWEFAREQSRKNDEALRVCLSHYNDEVDRCEVSGLVFVGDGETAGFKITGSLKCENEKIGLTSRKIKFEGDEIDLPDDRDLGEMVTALKNEVWMFLFKNKRGVHLFTEVEKKESGGLNNLKAV